ncbi:MAG: cellulase family glycosylhydrolase, partial [Nitrospinae bacterium]|nr:cellulase family glycosylhydrolase [Nitrospinota bacterium]
MNPLVRYAAALALALGFAACGSATETALVGGHEVPYQKLGMNVFPRNTVFGDANQQMADIAAMGITAVRINLWFDTHYMANANAARNFTLLDAAVNAARANNLEIVGILCYVPEWLKGRADWKAVYLNSYVIPVVTRYKGKINYWEIWNEPDELDYGVLNRTPEDYYDLVRRVAPTIRALDPGCSILSAATANIVADGTAKWDWTRALLNLGIKNYADILNFHYYGDLEYEL